MASPCRPLATLLVLAVLAGCGKGTDATEPTPPAVSSEVVLATAGITASPALLGDDLFDVTGSTGASARAAQPMSAIDPFSFYRWVRTSSRDFTFAFSDTDNVGRPRAADVSVRRDLYGMLHIIQRPVGDTPPDTHAVVHKVMHDVWTRHLHLVRELVPGGGGSWRWRIEQASGVSIASAPGTRGITSVHLVGTGLDVTVTDPAQLMALAQLPHAAVDDSVTVTVTTGAPDDVVALYWHDHRARMHANGDNTYTLRFSTGVGLGLRGLGVNALTHGTLYDDTLGYDSLGWIVPLWVGDGAPSVWP
jgi:hypothetical protein